MSLCNHSCKEEFDLHENEPVNRIHFHMNGFVQRFVWPQKAKGNSEWSIKNIKELGGFCNCRV